jgi:3-oxoacyl-[acyl-carrier protein] reductase
MAPAAEFGGSMDPMRSLRGAVALITGAGDGMGRATARLFARDGARVAVTDRDGERARAVAAEICAKGGDARDWAMDVSDPRAITDIVAQVAGHFGGVDVIVNNAGFVERIAIDAADFDDAFDRSIGVMLSAHQRVVRAALPHLRQSNAPRIVNIASTEGLGATAGNIPYNAAKAGVIGLTRALAVELGREGITVNCVCPGPIETAMTAPIPNADKDTFARRRTALRRYGKPEEVAHITLSLCLPAASFITGAIVPVDGGLSARFG